MKPATPTKKAWIVIDQQCCKSCELCCDACPLGLIIIDQQHINSRGYHPAVLVDEKERCTGCCRCAIICPDLCIEVFRQDS